MLVNGFTSAGVSPADWAVAMMPRAEGHQSAERRSRAESDVKSRAESQE